MNKFTYKEIEFEPILRLKTRASNFFEISKHINKKTEIKGFTHKEFYKIAKENDCELYDLFRVNGLIVIIGNDGYFRYDNRRLFIKYNIKYND